MNKDEIIKLARKAGIKRRTNEFYSEFCDGVYADDLEAFAKLIAQHEREACAKVCENLPVQQDRDVRDECAAAIRARGEKA
jgi:hypothetical protein